MSFWHNKRVVVTGGAGFLGSYIVKELEQTRCATLFVPRSRDYDLTHMDAVHQLYADRSPTL